MNRSGLQRVIDNVGAVVNLPLTAIADFSAHDQPIEFRVSGLHQQESFSLVCHRSPLTWIVDLKYDVLARMLATRCTKVAISRCDDLRSEIEQVESTGIIVETNVSELLNSSSPVDFEIHHFSMRLMAAKLRDQYKITEHEEEESLSKLLSNALILTSLLLSDFERNDGMVAEGDEEGELSRVFCNSYARSARNRARCLEKYGYTCQACFLNPEMMYGPTGRSVIHVHHRTPLSMMDSVSTVDPIRDLVPLCPNCHNYAHKRVPPFSPEEIRDTIERISRQSP